MVSGGAAAPPYHRFARFVGPRFMRWRFDVLQVESPAVFGRRANVSNLRGRGILNGDLSPADIGALAFVPPQNDDAGDINR